MTGRESTDHCRHPVASSRWRVSLLVAAAGVLVTVGVLVAEGDRPTVIIRGGVVEIQFATNDRSAQQALAQRCGLADATQITPVHVRYTFPARQTNDVLACVHRSSIVRAAALPG